MVIRPEEAMEGRNERARKIIIDMIFYIDKYLQEMFRGPGRWFEIKEFTILNDIERKGSRSNTDRVIKSYDITNAMREFIMNEYRSVGWQVKIDRRTTNRYWAFRAPANMKSPGII